MLKRQRKHLVCVSWQKHSYVKMKPNKIQHSCFKSISRNQCSCCCCHHRRRCRCRYHRVCSFPTLWYWFSHSVPLVSLTLAEFHEYRMFDDDYRLFYGFATLRWSIFFHPLSQCTNRLSKCWKWPVFFSFIKTCILCKSSWH